MRSLSTEEPQPSTAMVVTRFVVVNHRVGRNEATRGHNLPFMGLTINVAFGACTWWGHRDQGNESYGDGCIRERSKEKICVS